MTDTTTISNTPDQWFGAIAHTELGSNDPTATTTFLNTVFGMNFENNPMPMGDYFMSWVEGRPSCAVRGVMSDNEPGPSNTPYVSVEDIDATIAKATQNGATIMLPKTAVPTQGWMAWMTIPGGNTIAVWQMDPNAA